MESTASPSWVDVNEDPLSLLAAAEPAPSSAPAEEPPPARSSTVLGAAHDGGEHERQDMPFSGAAWQAPVVVTPTASAGDDSGEKPPPVVHHVERARRSLQEPLRHAAAAAQQPPLEWTAPATPPAAPAALGEGWDAAWTQEAPACDAAVLAGLPVWTPEAPPPPRAPAQCMATRYRLLPSGLPDFSVLPVEGRLRGSPDGMLAHGADERHVGGRPAGANHTGGSITWRAKTAESSMAAAPCSVRWLHESHPAVEPFICSGRLICADADEGLAAWLIEERASPYSSPARSQLQHDGLQQRADASPTVYLLCFRSMSDALRLEYALGDCVEMAWSAEIAVAMADGARIFGESVRGAAESLREQVRWAADYFVESVEGAEDRSAPVSEEVRDTMKAGRLALGQLAEMGFSVAGGVTSYAYVAGKEVAEAAEAVGVLAAFDNPTGRACAQVTGAGLRAASDIVTDLGDSAHVVMGESAEAITKAVAHTKGDAAAAVADDALSGAANVRDVVFAVAPVSLVKKAAFAGALGAAGMEEELAALNGPGATTPSARGIGFQGDPAPRPREQWSDNARTCASPPSYACRLPEANTKEVTVDDDASDGWESLGVACQSNSAEPSRLDGVMDGGSCDGSEGGIIMASNDLARKQSPGAQHPGPVFVPVD
jgi:hypothetical protein